MGEKTLVEGLLDDSIELVKKLDVSNDAPTLAAWYFYEDADQWRLLIAGPPFDQLLPKNEPIAYQKISEAISAAGLQSLSISMVKLIQTGDPLSKALHFLLRTPPNGIMKANFSNTTLNGIFIKEMIILRSA